MVTAVRPFTSVSCSVVSESPSFNLTSISTCWTIFKRCLTTITRGRGGPTGIQEVRGSDFWGRHKALTSFKASSYSTPNPGYDQPYPPQSPTQPPYGPDITQPGYQPAGRYMPSQPGYPPPPTFASSPPGYQPHFGDQQQPRYPPLPDPNYAGPGGYPSSAFSPYPRDEYQYQPGGNMIPSPASYQAAPQAPYGLQGPYGPVDHSPIQATQGTRPSTSTQPPFAPGISNFSTSGHQSPPLTTLRCTECDYTSSRQSDMTNHIQGHYPGASSGGRRSARNG